MQKSCKYCEHWRLVEEDKEDGFTKGRCYASPPCYVGGGRDDSTMVFNWEQPMVTGEHRCGMFKLYDKAISAEV